MKQFKAFPFLLWWSVLLSTGLLMASGAKRESAVTQAIQAEKQAPFSFESGGESLGTVEEIQACSKELRNSLRREAKLRGALRHMQTSITRLMAAQEVAELGLADLYMTAQVALAEEPPARAVEAK